MVISIIIPSYKPGGYIEKCLDSIEKQNIDKELFEIILVLNGCNEPWHSLLKKWIENTPKLNINLIQTNISGVSNARNIGLDVAKGEYITFIDDDDYISPGYLKELLKVSSIDCVGLSDSIYLDDSCGKLEESNIHHRDFLKLKNSNNLSLYSARRFFNGPVMKLIHRSIIGDRKFDIRFKNGEDSLFMALISDNIKKIKFTSEEAVYYRRLRDNSATTSKRSLISKIHNSLNLIKLYCIYWIGHPFKYNVRFMLSRVLACLKM